MSSAQRLDIEMVARGLAESRTQAQALVMAGEVRVGGELARKASQSVTSADEITVRARMPYVSRGGIKLAGALDDFGYDPAGLICADVGASTGGFTDLLLQRGATRVHAIDVGYGQMAWSLRQDPRVILYERTNARYLESLSERVDLTVMDASFISIGLLMPAIAGWLTPGGDLITLVKPQFEAGRRAASRGSGVIRDPRIHEKVLRARIASAEAEGWALRGLTVSPIKGPAGNIEFFMWLTCGEAPPFDSERALQQTLRRADTLE